MLFSLSQIFERCPLKITIAEETHTIYEWTIAEDLGKSDYLLILLDAFEPSELTAFKEDEKGLFDALWKIYLVNPTLIDGILSRVSTIKFDLERTKPAEIIEFLQLLILQNDIINRKLDQLKGQTNKKQYLLTLEDTILDVLETGCLQAIPGFEKINFINWKEFLTFRQLNYLYEKMDLRYKKRVFEYFQATKVAIGESFAKKEDLQKHPEFYDVLFTKYEKPNPELETIERRKGWFGKRFNDINFIVEHCSKHSMIAAEKIFTKEEIERYNIKVGNQGRIAGFNDKNNKPF